MKTKNNLWGAMAIFAFGALSAQQRIVLDGPKGEKISVAQLSSVPLGAETQSLNGTWQFSPEKTGQQAAPIEVPGEWVMQGFSVKPFEWSKYVRSFEVPPTWKGKRLKLRFNAVYSETEAFVNEKKQGYHLGGFTPFEFDITDDVIAGGSNQLKLFVKSESVTDSLSSASEYAVHPLGGITRSVTLYALPELNVSYFHASTSFDKAFKDAELLADVLLTNESASPFKEVKVQFDLYRKGSDKAETSQTFTVNNLPEAKQNKPLRKSFKLNVSNPLKWDPEHPNLYVLKMTLSYNGQKDVYEKNIGFRQIEVVGNQVFVNGSPIKLRGVCRHEVSPLRGRSLSGNQWAEDVKIFRDGNVNYIRTSHYPPDEKLAVACDSLGMFLEVEAPFCWAERASEPKDPSMRKAALESQTLDMVNTFKSHPSVLIWSMGNESLKYDEYFSATAELVKAFDPTRPRNFSQYGPNGDNEKLEIANHHYPGPGGPDTYRNSKRPTVFDEYAHLNAYNRRELYTDPYLRDAWGVGFSEMWNAMYASQGVLGGAIWAAIDDTFFLPNGKTVGYGTWGPIDGWRREKPEYWHMKKVYSPLRITLLGQSSKGGKTEMAFQIENRFLFSNLSECRFEWKNDKASGVLNVEAKQGQSTKTTLTVDEGTGHLMISVYDPRGVLCDVYSFDPKPVINVIEGSKRSQTITYGTDKNGAPIVKAGDLLITLDHGAGAGVVASISKKGEPVFVGDALLMLQALNGDGYGTQMTGEKHEWVPLTDTCTGRQIRGIELTKQPQEFVLTIKDEYNEALGKTTYRLTPDGRLEVSYKYLLKANINPRQWGLVFTLPSSFDTLKWSKYGLWNYYPDTHIGRLAGEAVAHNNLEPSGPAGPSKKPSNPWKDDSNELGTNDFRSTKTNIRSASLSNGKQQALITGDGIQGARAWTEPQHTRWLISKYNGHGAERFFRGHAAKYDKPLKKGDVISDKISISF